MLSSCSALTTYTVATTHHGGLHIGAAVHVWIRILCGFPSWIRSWDCRSALDAHPWSNVYQRSVVQCDLHPHNTAWMGTCASLCLAIQVGICSSIHHLRWHSRDNAEIGNIIFLRYSPALMFIRKNQDWNKYAVIGWTFVSKLIACKYYFPFKELMLQKAQLPVGTFNPFRETKAWIFADICLESMQKLDSISGWKLGCVCITNMPLVLLAHGSLQIRDCTLDGIDWKYSVQMHVCESVIIK